MPPPLAEYRAGSSNILVTAIHAGSAMRSSMEKLCALDRSQRLREEDPFTDEWTTISDNRIIGLRSRFEMDLNRPREKAVYRVPDDCWGLQAWKGTLPLEEVERSLAGYDGFYERTGALVERLLDRHPRVFIYDLHSYNHQRQGPGIDDDPSGAPEINLGTAHIELPLWERVVDALTDALRTGPDGRAYDVRANVKFKGGYFGQWLHDRSGPRVCPVAIEFKKVFMNEWTGEPDRAAIHRIGELLAASIGPVSHAMNSMRPS